MTPTEEKNSEISATAERTLPQGWHWVRLGNICKLINGDAFKPSDWSEYGTPIIRIQNLNDSSKPFNYWAGSIEDRVIVESGDLLLAWSGTPGTSFGAHIWSGKQGVLNQHIFRVDLTNETVSIAWAVLAINHELYHLIEKAHGGVGLRHVTKSVVESLYIPLPPMAEQKRIAEIFGEQMAAAERARAAVSAQLVAAKALAKAYLRTAFENDRISGWSKKGLVEVAALLPSKSIATDGDAEVDAITTACLTESGFDPRGIKKARMWSRDAQSCVVSKGEVLVARSNTPELVGRAAMFGGEPKGVVASDLTIRIRALEGLYAPFLAAYLSSLYASGFWKEQAGGASGTMKKITRTQIADLRIPVPELEKQKEIASAITRRFGEANRVCQVLAATQDALDHLPAALLRRALRVGN